MAPIRRKQKCMRAGPLTNNGYLNYIREFRQEPENCALSPQNVIIEGAKMWNKMNFEQKEYYKEMGPKGQQKKKKNLSTDAARGRGRNLSKSRAKNVAQSRYPSKSKNTPTTSRGRSTKRSHTPKTTAKARSESRSKSRSKKVHSKKNSSSSKAKKSKTGAEVDIQKPTTSKGQTAPLKQEAPCCSKSLNTKSDTKSSCALKKRGRKRTGKKSEAQTKGFLRFLHSCYRRFLSKKEVDLAEDDWDNLPENQQNYWMYEYDSDSD